MKRFLVFLFAVAFAGQAFAQTTYNLGNNVQGVKEGETLTISGTGDMYDFSDRPTSQFGNIKEVIIEDGVTSIGAFTFCMCSDLVSITIPSSVTRIGIEAFRGCRSLTSITIPNSVTSIGRDIFYGCSSLQYYNYNNAIYLGNDDNHYLCLIRVNSLNITSCEINGNCRFIFNNAFGGCTNLTSINIPNSVTTIGEMAFCGCTNLTSISIPESIISIGGDAFLGCDKLERVSFASIESLCSIIFESASANPIRRYLYINNVKKTQ